MDCGYAVSADTLRLIQVLRTAVHQLQMLAHIPKRLTPAMKRALPRLDLGETATHLMELIDWEQTQLQEKPAQDALRLTVPGSSLPLLSRDVEQAQSLGTLQSQRRDGTADTLSYNEKRSRHRALVSAITRLWMNDEEIYTRWLQVTPRGRVSPDARRTTRANRKNPLIQISLALEQLEMVLLERLSARMDRENPTADAIEAAESSLLRAQKRYELIEQELHRQRKERMAENEALDRTLDQLEIEGDRLRLMEQQQEKELERAAESERMELSRHHQEQLHSMERSHREQWRAWFAEHTEDAEKEGHRRTRLFRTHHEFATVLQTNDTRLLQLEEEMMREEARIDECNALIRELRRHFDLIDKEKQIAASQEARWRAPRDARRNRIARQEEAAAAIITRVAKRYLQMRRETSKTRGVGKDGKAKSKSLKKAKKRNKAP